MPGESATNAVEKAMLKRPLRPYDLCQGDVITLYLNFFAEEKDLVLVPLDTLVVLQSLNFAGLLLTKQEKRFFDLVLIEKKGDEEELKAAVAVNSASLSPFIKTKDAGEALLCSAPAAEAAKVVCVSGAAAVIRFLLRVGGGDDGGHPNLLGFQGKNLIFHKMKFLFLIFGHRDNNEQFN